MSIKIIRAKPNPYGKDKFGQLSPGDQLASEWVDVANTGLTSVSLNNLFLYHKTYNNFCQELDLQMVMSFNGVLNSGQVVRVHSGSPILISRMRYEDISGADYHLFTRTNYIWNNNCGDSPRLYNSLIKSWVDITYYDSRPIEGLILRRIGNKLM